MSSSRNLPALIAATLLLAACGRTAETGVPSGHATAIQSRPVMTAKNGLETMRAEITVATQDSKAPVIPGAKELDSFAFHGTTFHLMGLGSKGLLASTLAVARGLRGVQKADANAMCYAQSFGDGSTPNDEFFGMQYGLVQKQLPQAWSHVDLDPNLIVAVVDTGVDYTHPDLEGHIIQGQDLTFNPGLLFHRTDTNGPMDDNGHGTHCAGVISATTGNGIGVAGVAPGVKILAVKVLGADGSGSQYNVMKGVAYAVTNGAKIVSLSLGGSVTTSVERQFYETAVQTGALIVAAAGNSGDAVGFPAAYPGVLSVGATDSGGNLARFSNRDETMSVTAPGVGILSTTPHNTYTKMSGTSMAAPYVAGVAALVWCAHPDWTATQIKTQIEQSAESRGPASMYGHGEVNVLNAIGAPVTAHSAVGGR